MHRLTQHTDDPAEQVPLDLSEDQRAAIKTTVKKAQQSLAILPFLLEQSTVPGLTRAQARMAMETTEFELATLGPVEIHRELMTVAARLIMAR